MMKRKEADEKKKTNGKKDKQFNFTTTDIKCSLKKVNNSSASILRKVLIILETNFYSVSDDKQSLKFESIEETIQPSY